MSKLLPKTPAARFRRAAKTLAELGIKAELVRSCCRSCARAESDADLLATIQDLNPGYGWNKTGSETFRDWINWNPSSLEGRMGLVVAILNANGLLIDSDLDPTKALEVTFYVEPVVELTPTECGYCGNCAECGYCYRCGENDIQEDGRCSTCERNPELLDD